MASKPRKRSKIRPREAMHAKRAKAPEINPCPPGPKGGQYQPLTESDIAQIYKTALRILSDIGIGEAPPALQQQALAKGATLNDAGRLCYPVSMVEDTIAGACKQFMFFGRDPKHVADSLSNVSWFTRCCVATDVQDITDLDINTAYALIKGTNKPVGTSFTLGSTVDPIVDMFDATMGGSGSFSKRPCCKAHISPIISPLRYGEDAFDVSMAAIKHNMPLNNIIAAQSGATSPATIAGMLAATLAETLAALLMVNVFSPGYPMIFSNWPFVIDLRTGSFSGSGGEITLLNAASAQISNWLGLPSGVASSMSDAKAVDAQMGLEKAMSSLAVGLAGSNMVYESSGMMASLLGASFEAMLIDDEMLSQVYRVLRGIEVTEETLGFAAIEEAVYGEGHFLGSQHTMDAMQRDYFWPSDLSDRQQPVAWEEGGAMDMWQRANVKVRDILAIHNPEYLSTDADKLIRSRHNILLG